MRSMCRSVLVALVAALAFSAVAASASFALEKYEFLKGGVGISGKEFRSAQVGNSILRISNAIEITCRSGSSKGKFATNTSNVEKVKVTFDTCTAPKEGGGTCEFSNSGNPDEDELKMGEIKGTLGETTVGTTVGLDLAPETGSTSFVEIEGHPAGGGGCGLLTKLKGSVIGEVVSPINGEKVTGTLKFAENATKEQLIQNIEEEGSEGVVDNGDALASVYSSNRLINTTEIELTTKEAFEVHAPA